MNMQPIGWDHPDTARYYARFQRLHDRYLRANRELARRAAVAPCVGTPAAPDSGRAARAIGAHGPACRSTQARSPTHPRSPRSQPRILDVAAGDGGTAAAVLRHVRADVAVVCYEPASAMRELGRHSLTGRHVTWTADWPDAGAVFDHVLCGAAIWQLDPLDATFRRIFGLLRPGGSLCFDVPALYLGEPDAPGGGRDPMLVELPARLALEQMVVRVGAEDGSGRIEEDARFEAARSEHQNAPVPAAVRFAAPHDATAIDAMLTAAGFRARRWSFSTRFDQSAYRDWLKIPPTTDRLLLGLDADERARRIDAAFRHVDPGSWRFERWIGWTARRPRIGEDGAVLGAS